MKAFFIVGHKRSGSTHLMNLLNLHPKIFVSNESDVIEILYRFHKDETFVAHPWSGESDIKRGMEKCGNILSKNNTPAENFYAFQKCFMKSYQPYLIKKSLIWVSDQKPSHNADPTLVYFILDIFEDVRFIHLVRHPFPVAVSAKNFAVGHPERGSWANNTLEEVVELWTQCEKNVLELKRNPKASVLDVKYEDLCIHTEKVLTGIFRFLDLNLNEVNMKLASWKTKNTIRSIPKILCSNETVSIMAKYGYKPKGNKKSKIAISLGNRYWKIRKVSPYLVHLAVHFIKKAFRGCE